MGHFLRQNEANPAATGARAPFGNHVHLAVSFGKMRQISWPEGVYNLHAMLNWRYGWLLGPFGRPKGQARGANVRVDVRVDVQRRAIFENERFSSAKQGLFRSTLCDGAACGNAEFHEIHVLPTKNGCFEAAKCKTPNPLLFILVFMPTRI